MSSSGEAARLALVTGAASGIGAATVKALARAGFVVVGADVDDDLGGAVMATLGAPHLYRHLDVTDPDQWLQLVDELNNDLGGLNLLHLNAGVMTRPRDAPLLDDPVPWLTPAGMKKVVDVNLGGIVYGVAAALRGPSLSHIIMTASGAALLPLEYDPLYTMSKYGVLGFGLALEPTLRARGIRVDVVCPGAIDTQITAPDIRREIRQEPASFVGDAVATIATSDAPGPVWLAYNAADGLTRYDVPGLGEGGALASLDAADQ